jgi:hypothetical protein
MEILYVVGMIAVFVLCLALFSTARRILRSSALSNGQFGTSRMYDVEALDDEASKEIDSAEMAMPGLKAIYTRSNVALDDLAEIETPYAETAMAETVAPDPIIYEGIQATAIVEEEPVMAAYVPPPIPSWAEKLADEDDSEQPQANKWKRFRNPSRQKYNYALECLLLGVSAWVLIRTQRGTLRYRLSQTASDRVA